MEQHGGDTSRLERARLEIARLGLGDSAELGRMVGVACRASADALEVERVGIWLFSPKRDLLRCVELYERGRAAHSSGASVQLSTCPAYLAALESRRVIQADDARRDPRTACLSGSYLEPLGIGAMLDAPIFRGGDVLGVVCHEHVGEARVWSRRDVDFAVSVADMLGALFEQAGRLEAEERVARTERLEALNRLAGSVAHDFNNVLNAISLTAQHVLLAPPGAPIDPRGCVQSVVEQCELGARLVRQLLDFCRERPHSPVELDLVALVRGLAPMLETLLRGRCRLELDLPERPVRIRADRAHLEQVLINLAVNAADAARPGETGRVGIRVTEDDARAVLQVRDDGQGMAPEVLARAFEPFFSTKPRAQGGGLGLATVYGIVTRSGGDVAVASTPGNGATFTVQLPRG